MKDISKELQKEMRAWERIRKRHVIEKILLEFKGLHNISNIGNDGKKMRLTSVRDENGVEQHGRQEIVDVFATFYEELYKRRHIEHQGVEAPIQDSAVVRASVQPISKAEVKKQAVHMKNGTAADGSGLVTDMIKFGHDKMFEMIAHLFNEVLLNGGLPPAESKHTRIRCES